jgi:hypothetical protein
MAYTFKAPRESTCAGCWKPIATGQLVVSNKARGQRNPWFHAECDPTDYPGFGDEDQRTLADCQPA